MVGGRTLISQPSGGMVKLVENERSLGGSERSMDSWTGDPANELMLKCWMDVGSAFDVLALILATSIVKLVRFGGN